MHSCQFKYLCGEILQNGCAVHSGSHPHTSMTGHSRFQVSRNRATGNCKAALCERETAFVLAFRVLPSLTTSHFEFCWSFNKQGREKTSRIASGTPLTTPSHSDSNCLGFLSYWISWGWEATLGELVFWPCFEIVCAFLQMFTPCNAKESISVWSHELGNQSLIRPMCYARLLENLTFGFLGSNAESEGCKRFILLRAATTKYHRLGGFKNIIVVSSVLEVRSPRSRWQHVCFVLRPPRHLQMAVFSLSLRGLFLVYTQPWCLFLFF